MFKLSIFTLLVFSVFVFNTKITKAQLTLSSIDGVNFNSTPENPSPGESVQISIESFSVDLPSSSITWIVGGKTFKQGIGLTSIDLMAPNIGSDINISVIIKTVPGQEIRKNYTLRSSSVDFIWETNGHKTPFFQGKNNLGYQNKVKVIAIPHLSYNGKTEVDPKDLVYRWKQDGKYIDNGVGYGTQAVTIESGIIPKNLEISVEVQTRDGSLETSESLSLEPQTPSVVFYEESPLYGLLNNKALVSRVPLKNSEMRIRAIPFGFSTERTNDDLKYVWSVNNIEQENLAQNRTITIRTKGDTEGSSLVHLRIQNINEILQGGENSVTVYFNKKKTEENDNQIIF